MPGCDGCIVNMHGHPTPPMNMIALQAALDAGIQYEVAHVTELSELERDETNSQLKTDRRQPTLSQRQKLHFVQTLCILLRWS